MFKLTWFIIGFAKRTRSLQSELKQRDVDLNDKLWNRWIGF